MQIRQYFPQEVISQYKIDVLLVPGSHQTEDEVNKQINDKERVAAAFDNPTLMELVKKCTRDAPNVDYF